MMVMMMMMMMMMMMHFDCLPCKLITFTCSLLNFCLHFFALLVLKLKFMMLFDPLSCAG